MATLVNGQEYAWAQIKFNIANVDIKGITACSYEDTTEKVMNWGAGSRPVSRSRGKYEAKASITLHMSEVMLLQAAAPNGDLAQLPDFDIVVSYIAEAGQLPVVDKIRACQFMGNKRDLTQSPDGITVELELMPAEIQWGQVG